MLGSVSARACDGADCITVVVLNMNKTAIQKNIT